MSVKIYYADIKVNLPQRRLLKAHIRTLFLDQQKNLESLTYVFTSDEHLLDVNRNFLNHDYYTDVITFDLSADRKRITGEVYISTERVKENAQQLGVDFLTELHRVMIHGALHLCGYKDKTSKDQLNMRKLEEKYLAKLTT
jgi:probable rRNA maturation factor